MEIQKGPICRCPLRLGMTKEELLEEIYIPQKNCCHPEYICSNLDKEMRRATKENVWKSKLKGTGKTRTSSTAVVNFKDVELDFTK